MRVELNKSRGAVWTVDDTLYKKKRHIKMLVWLLIVDFEISEMLVNYSNSYLSWRERRSINVECGDSAYLHIGECSHTHTHVHDLV